MQKTTKLLSTFMILSLVLFSFGACSDNETNNDDNNKGEVSRGPKLIDIDGDANGLWWDDASQTLYVADDNNNRILTWKDATGFSLLKDLPAAAEQGSGLGQLVITPGKEIVVTRFGFGKLGDVAYVDAAGNAKTVPNLDKEKRRIGLTIDSKGQLYDSWFVRLENGERAGAIGKLSLSGTEEEVITGLKKPVAVLAVGDELFVSDQDLGQILRAPIASPGDFTVLTQMEKPDLLAVGPDNTLFAGSASGNVYKVTLNGQASVFQTGFQAVRGVAYDPTNRRLFVAEHDEDESDGLNHAIHILPVD